MLIRPPAPVIDTATGRHRNNRSLMIGIAITLALLAPFLFYFDTARSIVAIWNSSETFAHGYIILPISLWLIWRRRENFRALPPQPWWPALALIAVVGMGWFVARMGAVQVVMQYAFAALIPAIALAVFGRRLAWSLAFPLLFVLLAVPFGDVFIDPLISFTADFTVRALQITGIPVLRNGTRFEIPSGSWSVVEACSGVRYLISSITLGCLYAYLTYRSTLRRAAFMLTAVLVPILANGLRAYMIVMIGHLSGMTMAVGFDHLIYGWVFFGLVMFLMFWIGSYWREDPVAQPAATLVGPASAATLASAAGTALNVASPRAASPRAMLAIAIAVVAVSAIWPLLATYNDRVTFNPAPVQLAAPAVAWERAANSPITTLPTGPDANTGANTGAGAAAGMMPATTSTSLAARWAPRFAMPDARFVASFVPPANGADNAGNPATAAGVGTPANTTPVDLTILYYRNQRNDKALISSTNRLVNEKDAYHQVRSSVRTERIGTRQLAVREAELAGPGANLLVWSWYWIDGDYTASNYGGKLMEARAKLLFRGDDGAALLLATPVGVDADAGRTRLRAFLAAALPGIDAALADAGKR